MYTWDYKWIASESISYKFILCQMNEPNFTDIGLIVLNTKISSM